MQRALLACSSSPPAEMPSATMTANTTKRRQICKMSRQDLGTTLGSAEPFQNILDSSGTVGALSDAVESVAQKPAAFEKGQTVKGCSSISASAAAAE